MITFYDFMMDRYRGKNNRFGDLAEDMERDPDFPRDTIDRETVRHYLASCLACADCMNTFSAAWRNYKKFSDSKEGKC